MNLRIIKGGILDTIQDLGRYHYQYLGINPTGAMDRLSAQIANVLVGNHRHEAVIELHFPASEFFFEQSALIAVTGADFSATVNAETIPVSQPVLVSKYSILQFHRLQYGARAYLAIRGGLDIPAWLNSYSTHIKAAAGGYKGRVLQKDDEIRFRSTEDLSGILEKKEFRILPWKAEFEKQEQAKQPVFLLPGNEWDWLDEPSKQKLQRESFTISSHSDRMGYRLQGEPLSLTRPEEIVSSAVSFGTMQLPLNGQPILLMADHQTTGGYPRIAHAITAHHARLAQLRAGDALRFQLTDPATAEELLIKQQQHLQQLQNACTFRLEEFFKT